MHTHITIGQFYRVKEKLPDELSGQKFAEFYQLTCKVPELLTKEIKLILSPLDTDLTYKEVDKEHIIEEGKLHQVFMLVTDRKLLEILEEFKLAMIVDTIEKLKKMIDEQIEHTQTAHTKTESETKQMVIEADPTVIH